MGEVGLWMLLMMKDCSFCFMFCQFSHACYRRVPGIAGGPVGEAGGGGAELPLPPMSSFRAAAPHHSPTEPMLVAKPPLQPVSTLLYWS